MKKVILIGSIMLMCSNLSAISTTDYEGKANKLDLATYGYANPMDGFVGATLLKAYFATHYYGGKKHLGTDIMSPAGTKIYSICDGKIKESQDMTYKRSIGRSRYLSYWTSRVIVQCNEPKCLVIYGHVDNVKFSKGNKVTKGLHIGELAKAYNSNNVRYSRNDHLHFGINLHDKITYNKYWGFGIGPSTATRTDAKNKGFIDPFTFLTKNGLTNNSKNSVIDGAGSLVSPNEYCWGCDRDQANMQSHSGENSTVVFQWRYDKDSCSQIDISADRDIGDVIIRAKGWKDKITKVATSVKLSSSPISIRRPNRKSNWTTLAVTTQKPLTKEAKIYAYCKKKGSNYLNGNRGSASKDFVNFNLDYVWSGTGSLISRSKKSNYDGFGHNRDWAVTYFKKKSLTTFQWDTTTCHEITITNGKTDDYYANNVKVDIKGWNLKDWKSACYELPCTIEKTDDYYYILKIKSPVGAITKGYIQVKCED